MDGKVVVLLRTSSVARAPVYQHLRSLGAILVVVHPYTPMAEFDGIFHHWLQHETDDMAALRAALAAFLSERHLKPDAIVSFDEYAVYQAALLAEECQLTAVPLPPAAVQQNNLKDRFRLFCKQQGIQAPGAVRLVLPQLPSPADMHAYASASEGERESVFDALRPTLEAAIASTLHGAAVEFPIVLKPSPGAGSLLARQCSTLEEATSHVWRMWQTLANHPDTRHFTALANGAGGAGAECGGRGCSRCSTDCPAAVHILAEEYVGGQEVDVDCVVEHGVVRFCAISDNFATAPPYFAEVGGLCPSALDLEGQLALRSLLESYVRAHGEALHGVLHFEAKYDPARHKAYVIEVNLRPGSAETNAMLQTVYREISLGESVVRCALQLPIQDQLARHYSDVLFSPRGGSPASPPLLLTSLATDSAAAAASNVAEPEEPMWRALGGPSRGFFPPQCWAASVNIYPARAGVLRKVRAPTEDVSLVAFSISAKPGDTVAPPPQRFYLLSWMVAHGKTAEEAKHNIDYLTATFVQEIESEASVHA